MASMRSLNPIAFRKWPVTVLLLVLYLGLITGVLYVNNTVAPAPKTDEPAEGISLSRAWSDLQHLSAVYHPFNSHKNDGARDWILQRIKIILKRNEARASYSSERDDGIPDIGDVAVFDDKVSNATFSASNAGSTSVYFEGSNIIVYLRGQAEPQSKSSSPHSSAASESCVLVNAHFDSVSTGYGATDDGVGVISLLQLLSHYTTPGNKPQQCMVLLFNNGEEDYLNGARVFGQHPISSRITAFLNLEGAGAGGRASMFRSTDAEVARAYRKSPYPFGTALSADGFKQGLVRSQTDYVVFNENLGYRGVDVAFIEPRSRYHTISDSTRETSIKSVWHMLSAALATTHSMLNHGEYKFEAEEGTEPVYFDLFGRALGLLDLDILVDTSIAVLVIGPMLLVIVAFFLAQQDKWYVFAGEAKSDPLDPRTPDDQITIHLKGRRGFFRMPVTLVLSTAAAIGLGLLVAKANPLIIYSSPYAVWSMTISAFLVLSWFCLCSADRTRPTALQRLYALAWLYVLSWVLLVFITVIEVRLRVCGAYIGLFLNASTLLALAFSLLELLNLPKKTAYVEAASRSGNDTEESEDPPHAPSRPLSSGNDDDPSESSPLLGSRSNSRRRVGSQTRFSRIFSNQPLSSHLPASVPITTEQPWSASLPSSLWLLQFLILSFNIILVGQIGTFLTSALPQTLGDGGSAVTLYLAVSGLSVLLLSPTLPFIHRLASRVTLFLLAVFIGCLIYNLTAFPFSRENRLKVYFQERLDLSSHKNTVTLTAVDPYVQSIALSIPGVPLTGVSCTETGQGSIKGLTTCNYTTTLTPNIPHGHHSPPPYSNSTSATNISSWVTVHAERTGLDTAQFQLSGLNTRACKLLFDTPVADYNVTGSSAQDERFVKVPDGGVRELRLWSRDWEKTWEVDVRWEKDVHTNTHREKGRVEKGELTGKAVCLWSDANDPATIPAFTEVQHYMPKWSVVTKAGDGLVEGWVPFSV